MSETPLKLVSGPRAPTTMATMTTATSTVRADTTTGDADDATAATMTATIAGRRIGGVRGLSDRACRIQHSPHVSGLRPTSPGTTETQTPTCGLRTTDSRATRAEGHMISSSSRICRSTSVTLHRRGSSTCPAVGLTIGQICVESSSKTSRAHTPATTSNGSCATANRSRGKACVTTSDTFPSAAPSFATPSHCSRMARPAPPSSIDSGAACLELLGSSSTSRATTHTTSRQSQ
jgi:hypothetical protein